MADGTDIVDASINSFFKRSGLTFDGKQECFDFIKKAYPGKEAVAASCQGFCSLTVFVGSVSVIQFRPYNYRLDLRLTSAARAICGVFAPETHYIATLPRSGLLVYSMERIDGISFKEFRMDTSVTASSTSQRAALCRDLARFLARSWNETTSQTLPLGLVGRTLGSRVQALVSSLPPRFQSAVKKVQLNLRRIESLPWVLNHGDIVAGNIMVDPFSGRLTGLVDWTEAERLPFGICFYGLEELLGQMTSSGFSYRHDSSYLRSAFWAELALLVPELKQSHKFEAVKLARDLGVLLWHGIAFDNGAIDRVVQEGRDTEEIQRLDAFLIADEATSFVGLPRL